MSLARTCDVGDCQEPALFMVGVWNEEEANRLIDSLDVCGPAHARVAVKAWLKDMAVVEESA